MKTCRRFIMAVAILFVVAAGGMAVACPPVITSPNNGDIFFAGASYTDICTATGDMTITWSGAGTFEPATGTTVSWSAPNAVGDVNITATNGHGSDTVTVTVIVQNIFYVDKDATGNNDGTTWANAFGDVNSALDAVNSGNEIWVAEGTYKPSKKTDPNDSRTATFQLVSGVTLYGGFDGTETDVNERDWLNNVTILSGDIGTVDDYNDNCYKVVVGANTASIDGFSITEGLKGVYCDGTSPTVSNCEITGKYSTVAQDMVAHWRLDDNDSNTTVVDSSGNGNNGTFGDAGGDPNTNAHDANGIIDGALVFNGNDDYVGANGQLVSGYPFTMSAWFKTTEEYGGTIISLADASSSVRVYRIRVAYHTVQLQAMNVTPIWNESVIGSSVWVDDGEWHFVVGVYESNTVKELYLDGEHQSTMTNDASYSSQVDRWSIGRLCYNNPTGYFNGSIDNVTMFDYALSLDEIRGLYNSEGATLTCNVIEDNNSYGVYATGGGSPTIENCKIGMNANAGIYSSSASPPVITNNWIYANETGIELSAPNVAATVRNNTIVDNNSYGTYVLSGTGPNVTNCILWGNGVGDCNGGATVTYSCIEDINDHNGVGNIGDDPRFFNTCMADYHLVWNSPCYNAGDPNYQATAGEKDIDGENRVIDARVEMGGEENDLFPNELMFFGGGRGMWGISHVLEVREWMQYFSGDFTWTIGGTDTNEVKYVISELHRMNPNAIVGSYLSSCTTKDYDPNDPNHLLISSIDIDDVNDEWFLRDPCNSDPNTNRFRWSYDPNSSNYERYFLDMRDANVRAVIIDLAVEKALEWGFDALSFDNTYYNWSPNSTVVSYNDWTQAFSDFFGEAEAAADANGLEVYINIAMLGPNYVDGYADLEPNVDGIMNEMAFHRNRASDDGLKDELQAYENVIAAGKKIFLFPSGYNNASTAKRERLIEYALTKIRALSEQYGNIYVIDPVGTYTYEEEPLYTVSTNLVSNGDFNDWTSDNPDSWSVTGESGADPEISEVGYIPGIWTWPEANEAYLEGHGGSGTWACNLYTSGSSDVNISQDITTVTGETYRFSIYVGRTVSDDPNLDGTVKVYIDNGSTAEYSYDMAGVKTFDFDAVSTTTGIKISNDPDGSGEVNITFDDVAVWRID